MKAKIGISAVITVLVVALTGCDKAPKSSIAGAMPQPQALSLASEQKASSPEAAVQRDYPTVAEEKALKLAYPLFMSYGPDSARITPFFPGASKQPVAVRLAPNQSGYVLQAQGNMCAFPLVYQLKTADGKQLTSGVYSGTAAKDLTGWNAQAGAAVLTVEMSSGAKNNYGCNIVVSKK